MITTSRDEFARAVRLHQAGDLGVAARLYESVLSGNRFHADALHLLGALRHQEGQHALAAELIGRALALRPDVAIYHASLAEVYRGLGRLEEAVARACDAIRLGHTDPAVRNNLGLALHVLGRYAEAAGAFLAVLESHPDDAFAHTNLGAALRELGETERALTHMKRAAELVPQLAPAQNNLGQYLLELDRPAEALGHCLAAVALQPEMAEAHHSLGNVYRALGYLAEARWCYEAAISKNPAMSQACVSLAVTLQKEGRWDDALPWLRRAIKAQPGCMEYLELLAESAVEREQFAEAITCYEQIVERDPANEYAHHALGWLQQEEGRLELSAIHLERALTLKPDLAAAQLNLGGLHEIRGKFAEAETHFRLAKDDSSTRGVALARLAMLLRAGLADQDFEAMQQFLIDADPSDRARVNVLFGLAEVWDARGDYTQAARYAREANGIALARLNDRNLVPDRAVHERFVSGLIDGFDPDLFERLAGAGKKTRRPVFIFGLPRSGTTLVEQILASHSQFHSVGELKLARRDFEAIPELLGIRDSPVACIPDLTRPVVNELAERHDSQLRALDGGSAARAGDKMPDNYLHLGLLAILFPDAVFIHCHRDLRDVATSCWLTPFRSVHWSNDETHIAARFHQYVRLMNHWRSVLPVAIHDVAYEDTVDHLERVARQLVQACGLEWEPACLDFHKNNRPVRTASVRQVRQPIYRSSLGRWKNYEADLANLFAALPA